MIRSKNKFSMIDSNNSFSSDDLFSLMINNTHDALYFYSIDGKLFFVNDTFEVITGYTTEELYSKNFIDFVHPEDVVRTTKYWNGIFEGKLFEDVEYRIIKKNGDVRWSSSSWRVVLDKEGNQIGILGKQQDITERVERENDFTKERIKAANQVNAKTNFLANMSHEIRTPISAIIGFTDLLKMYPDLKPEKRIRYIENIHSSSNHLLKLLEDILDFSKLDLDAMTFEEVYVNSNEFFSNAYNALGSQANKKELDYTLYLEPEIPEYIKIDPTRLRQVLFNLISNAIKFTKKGYVQINIGYSKTTNQLVIEVRDSGIGISESQKIALFNPYDQLNVDIPKEFGGTGLGLCLSQKIIEKLGGKLKLKSSKINKGSVFTCSMKVEGCGIVKGIDMGHRMKTEISKKSFSLKNILNGVSTLIFERNKQNALILDHLFWVSGAKYKIVTNAFDTVVEAKLNDYDIVLMDLRFPLIENRELACVLREEGFSGRIIAFNSFHVDDSASSLNMEVFDDFICKPFDIEKLIGILQEHISN